LNSTVKHIILWVFLFTGVICLWTFVGKNMGAVHETAVTFSDLLTRADEGKVADVTIDGDRPILVAAVSNLLQNAFKFSRKGGGVSLRTQVTAERVLFDIQDECGGLPAGKVEELFAPF